MAPQSIQKMTEEVLGVNICCSSTSALCQTGNNDGKSWNFTPYLYQREIQAVELQGAARKQRETRRRGRWNTGVRFPEWWWWHSIFGARGWFLPRKRSPLQKNCSLQQQNCVQLIFLYLRCYGTMGLRDLLCLMHLLKLLFVSLILIYLYLYVCPWSKFNERRSLPWPACVIRARIWKLLKRRISSFWWKEINSRLTVTIDFNGSMLVNKIITHRIGNRLRQSGSGLAGINLRDYGIERKF